MTRGTNAGLMKENNKKLILNLIRQGNYSRADLAKVMKLTKATLSILTDELKNEGLILEENTDDYSGVGRRPVCLKIRQNGRYVIGVALTRSGYHTGLFDLGGNPVKTNKHKYSSDRADDNLCDMAKIIKEYKTMVDEELLIGVGVATPGPLDYKSGTILNPPNFPVWHNCELGKKLSELCGLPVKLDNIANAMAVAEQYFGCCQKERDFAYIVVDEGIGSGIVVDGEIYRSQRGYGNELGHISIDYNGLKCSCGNRGCLERYASIPAILKNTDYDSWGEVVSNQDKGIINQEAEYLSCGIVSMLNLFDLETIVLGGTIGEDDNLLIDSIGEKVNKQAIGQNKIRIVTSKVGQNRAMAGASVALSKFFF
ncbi:MAG: ROK family transcriptional regulator [Clostridia bacterium]|nr:ROK family transcriptional regulator [Clostridia bacterium]